MKFRLIKDGGKNTKLRVPPASTLPFGKALPVNLVLDSPVT
jgi:hypothetical protein